MRRHISLWVPFLTVSLLTVLVNMQLWNSPAYWFALTILAVLSLFLALRVIVQTKKKWWSAALVIVVLVIGQWWLIERMAAFTVWGVSGFVP